MSDFFKKIEENWKKLEEQDARAKADGKLIGRYITEPFADGQAVYVITGEFHVACDCVEHKDRVIIQVATGLGDDWVIPYWGERTSIRRDYAVGKIMQRENIEKLFSKKGADSEV